jgi:hypothetical protein
MMAEQADNARASSELSGWLIPGLVPPLLGILAYAILRESYVWFYGQYGVVPEDVGLSQIGMLTGMLRIFHLWKLEIPGSPAANFGIVLLGICGYFAAGRWLLRRLCAQWPDMTNSAVRRHPLLLGISVLLLGIMLTSAWVLPNDRHYAGRMLQLRRGVRPSQLAMLAIQADPVQVFWTGSGDAPSGLVGTRLVYLGRADGVMVLYDPPDWAACELDACRGAVWRVNESDAVVRVEVDPPDRQAPAISR